MKNRRSFFLWSSIVLLFFGVSSYVWSGFRILIPHPAFTVSFWGIILCTTAAFIRAVSRMRSHGMGTLFKVASHSFLILLTANIAAAAVLLAGDVYRFFYSLANLASGHAFSLPSRNLYWVGLAVITFCIVVLLFAYGMVRGKYAYRVIRHTLYFDDLPAAFDGFRITQISDVHAGSFTRSKAVQKGIDLIQQQEGDLFVFTGDLVNNRAEEIKPWIDHFSRIRAPYGQFSILGNHDYGDYVPWPDAQTKQQNLEQLKVHHAELGFRLLLDEHIMLTKNGEQLVLAGVENWGIGFGERGDLKKALKGTNSNDFKILLSHDPSHWEAEVKKYPSAIHLTLSGHTHGMQFGIEALGLKWSPVKYRYRHWAGLKEEFGRILNVNRGFGFIGFSGRVGIWPEISVITLKRGVAPSSFKS